MNPLLIRNARLLDPEGGYDGPGAVRVRDGFVFEVLRSAQADSAGAEEVVDARGAALAPGLIDLRARGTPDGVSRLAAAAGVSTAVLASDPSAPADGPARVAALAAPGRAGARILPAAAATQAMEGERLAEIGLLHEAGAVLVSDGDRAIGDSRVLRRVLRYAAGFGVPVAHRPVDVHLSRGAVAAEGEFAARLGLSGVPDVAERIGLERDVAIAEGTGAPLHLDGLSTAVGVAALAAAKARGPRSRGRSPSPTFASTRSTWAGWTPASAWTRRSARSPTAAPCWTPWPTERWTSWSPATWPCRPSASTSPTPRPTPAAPPCTPF